MSEETCKIIKSHVIKINDATEAYGGGISNFSITLGGITSQTKASISLVGPELEVPQAGDEIKIKVMDLELNMQVGGYSLNTSASGASTLQLNLYDNSNIYLDHNHIVLKEEAPEPTYASNIYVLGRKVGTIPNKTLNRYGIRTGDVDTLWGDVRNFFEAFTPFWAGGIDGWKSKVDSYVRSNAGKTIWRVNQEGSGTTLVDALGNILAEGSDLIEGQFDFKGSFRDVISSYCSATSLQAWWDLENDELVIKRTKSQENGLAKLNVIKETCKALSSTETADFTSTFTKGALGSITSSYQGENQKSSGYSVSRYFRAQLLNPTFHYKACRHKNWANKVDKFTALDLESKEVLQAMRAAANDTIWGTYVCQSMLSFIPVPNAQVAGANFNNALNVKNITEILRTETFGQDQVNGQAGAANEQLENLDWETQFQPDPYTAGRYNSIVKDYYLADNVGAEVANPEAQGFFEATCPARVVPVKFKPFWDIALEIAQLADQEKKNGKQKNNGWNNNDDSFPQSKCGSFIPDNGQFKDGKLFLLQNLWFDSILGEGGLGAGDDLLKAYLLALYNFYQRFYVVKDDSFLVSARINDPNGNNVDYGYYLTSDTQMSPLKPTSEGDLEPLPLNPLLAVGECGSADIENLAKACAAMYLPKNTNYTETLNRLAVIDFIYALEQGGKNIPNGQPTSLMKVFENIGAAKNATPLRAQEEEDQEDPTLRMYLIARKDERDPLMEPFLKTEGAGRGGKNQNIIAGDSESNILAKACEGRIQKLPLSGNPALSQIFGNAPVKVGNDWKSMSDLEGAELYKEKSVELWAMGVPKKDGREIDLTTELPLATLPEAAKNKIKLWYDVSANSNAVGAEPNEWVVTSATAPQNNPKKYWTSKMDYGVSLNAADVGMDNKSFSEWQATAANAGNLYSISNRSAMKKVLARKVGEAAFSDPTIAKSTSLSIIIGDDETFELPTMDEGLEALQINVSGGKTTVSLTVGNSLQRTAMKNIYDRMVQSPSSLYRPGSVIQESLLNTTPTFQIRQLGLGG